MHCRECAEEVRRSAQQPALPPQPAAARRSPPYFRPTHPSSCAPPARYRMYYSRLITLRAGVGGLGDSAGGLRM